MGYKLVYITMKEITHITFTHVIASLEIWAIRQSIIY